MSSKFMNSGLGEYFALWSNFKKSSERKFIRLMYIMDKEAHIQAILYLNPINFCSPLLFGQED